MPPRAKLVKFSPGLSEAVHAQLHIDGRVRPLPVELVASLRILKGVCSGIIYLAGIEECIGLQEVDLSANAIYDACPLSALVELRKLYLRGNVISNVEPLSHLANLIDLNLGANMIKDIAPLAIPRRYAYLYLSMNYISDIKPLVDNCDNGGLCEGCEVFVSGNPLNRESKQVFLPYLRSRGVKVTYLDSADDSVERYKRSAARLARVLPR